MDKLYFGTREVKSATQPDVAVVEDGVEKIVPHNEFLIEYADEKDPRYEAISVEEWEAGKSSEPVITLDEYQKWSVKRLQPLREALMEPMKKFNPRFKDIHGVLDWMEFGFKSYLQQTVDKAFKQDFMTETTVDQVVKKIEERGEDPTQGLSDLAKDVLVALRKHGAIASAVSDGRVYKQFAEQLAEVINYGVEITLGSSDECRRLNDIEDAMTRYELESSEAGTEPTPVEGEASKQDASVSEDGTGGETTPAPESSTS